VNTRDDDAPTIPAPEPSTTRRAIPDAYQHYVVERCPNGALWELGRGGMGVTYKAMDSNLHSPVALKIIGPQCFGGENSRRQFVREARLAAQIRHPNVAAIFHLDTEGEELFYAMEFVDGVTADAWVKNHGPMTVELALDVTMQIARALTAADSLKLVHRDIKPANVMLRPDPADSARLIAKVIDFGLARSLVVDDMQTLTASGYAGTPQYSSPEQVENLPLDIRADIYSLGCTLWYLLTGEAPYVGSPARVIAQHLTSEPPWNRLGRVPQPLCALLRHMLAKDPAARLQNPVELHREICACRENAKPPQRQLTFIPLWRKLSAVLARDRPRRLVAAGATVVLLALGFMWLLFPSQNEARTASVEAVTPNLAPQIPTPPPPSVETPDDIPGLVAVPPNRPERFDDASLGESSVQLTNFDSDSLAFPLPYNAIDAAKTVDLRAGNLVSLSLEGLALSPRVGSTDKLAKKAHTNSRKRVSDERRSAPFKPVEGIRRGVQGLINRIF
jgi:serine/threonine protein kinase